MRDYVITYKPQLGVFTPYDQEASARFLCSIKAPPENLLANEMIYDIRIGYCSFRSRTMLYRRTGCSQFATTLIPLCDLDGMTSRFWMIVKKELAASDISIESEQPADQDQQPKWIVVEEDGLPASPGRHWIDLAQAEIILEWVPSHFAVMGDWSSDE